MYSSQAERESVAAKLARLVNELQSIGENYMGLLSKQQAAKFHNAVEALGKITFDK